MSIDDDFSIPKRSPREKAKDKLAFRQQAYKQVFNPENQAVKEVLKDLALFCRANSPTFNPDSRVHAVLEGRRETWLRIQRHCDLDPSEFLKLCLGKDTDDE